MVRLLLAQIGFCPSSRQTNTGQRRGGKGKKRSLDWSEWVRQGDEISGML